MHGLHTERLLLRASGADAASTFGIAARAGSAVAGAVGAAGLAAGVASFYRRNQARFEPWDPPRPADFATSAFHAAALAAEAAETQAGRVLGWWLHLRDDPARVIGSVRFSQISRAASQSAMLGYAIDGACEGRGLMAEALRAALAHAFGPAVNLHRVQANARPENARSLVLLTRLGFAPEGIAKDYLFIDGAWRDHVMCALLNPGWRAAPFAPR